ncbi:Metallo-dependent hydrolase [Amanita rubescens]|nr:Metallo-dependent hydrolase [Amanita rubescens]
MKNTIAGPAAAALKALSPNQLAFIQSLPKAELHAHLNGSIPLEALQHLAKEYLSRSTSSSSNSIPNEDIRAGVKKFSGGISLDKIDDFFVLFPAIYALTATRAALAYATRAVLSEFLDGESPQCTYLELRSTPKETEEMTREDYLRTVLDEVERYPKDRAAFIVSLDRRMCMEVMVECVEAAVKLKREGRRVVGIDLCGDPRAGDVNTFEPIFEQVRNAGLGITLHIAETTGNSDPETFKLLSYKPQRLGHGTFLTREHQRIVHDDQVCIEICLSSNLLCKTVPTLDAHHIRYYIHHGHPIAICTDDILPFRTSLIGEYALLMAPPPFGLGLSKDEVSAIAKMSMDARFDTTTSGEFEEAGKWNAPLT